MDESNNSSIKMQEELSIANNNKHLIKHSSSSVNNDNTDTCGSDNMVPSSNSWVKFDEQTTSFDLNDGTIQISPEVLNDSKLSPFSTTTQQKFAIIDLSNTCSVQINDSNMNKNNEPINNQTSNSIAAIGGTNTTESNKSGFCMRISDHYSLSEVLSLFLFIIANGDIIVTLYPLNDNCAWITPATFKAHLVPEELMAQPLTLTVEDYVSTMSILLNDYRFHLYITLHKRILAIWITLSIIVLLGILSSGTKGLSLFLSGILWLVLNALGIFIVIFIKTKLYRMLEECLSQVNSIFARHNIFLGVDDRGHFSCHKIDLIFVYFDSKYCIKFLQDMLKNNNDTSHQTNKTSTRNELTIMIDEVGFNSNNDIYITGSSGTKQVSQKEKQAEKLLFRYSQQWIREFGRQRMSLSVINPQPVSSITNDLGSNTGATISQVNNSNIIGATSTSSTDIPPRHCRSAKCFCQYIEELYRFKQQQSKLSFCYSCLNSLLCIFSCRTK